MLQSIAMRIASGAVLGGVLAALSATASVAQSAGSVVWTAPTNGATFSVGTTVNPTGQASISGVVGGDLDLILVLDSSGSMLSTVPIPGSPSRQQLQAQAANALATSLPAGTAIGVVEFDSNATLLQSLTTLPGGLADVQAAVASVDAAGGTDIRDGINAANAELDANGRAGTTKQILVMSDGDIGTAATNAAVGAATTANSEGYTVSTVGFPGAGVDALQDIATAGGGTFVNFSTNPQDIIDIFSGAAGGVLAGVERVEVTDPDGSVFEATVSALGNFNTMDYDLKLGANTWTVTSYFTDMTSATASLTLFGASQPGGGGGGGAVVPLPAPALLLLGGLAALAVSRRRRA